MHDSEASPDIVSIPVGHWPQLLTELPDNAKPRTLYIKGSLPPADALMVAVVGTRRPTRYGLQMTERISATLARAGIIVVSGLALGIDGAAHETALKANGKTIAVLGSGLSEKALYPRLHRDLARRIVRSGGALMSEYEPEMKGTKWTFPERNRIIAGLVSAVVIVEAQAKSGTKITAKYALEYGRDVFAVPGPVTSDYSRGTNELIRDGAIPILDPEDVLSALGIEAKKTARVMHDFTPEEERILETLSEPRTIDELMVRAKIERTNVFKIVSLLELKGVIGYDGNNTYRKL